MFTGYRATRSVDRRAMFLVTTLCVAQASSYMGHFIMLMLIPSFTVSFMKRRSLAGEPKGATVGKFRTELWVSAALDPWPGFSFTCRSSSCARRVRMTRLCSGRTVVVLRCHQLNLKSYQPYQPLRTSVSNKVAVYGALENTASRPRIRIGDIYLLDISNPSTSRHRQIHP